MILTSHNLYIMNIYILHFAEINLEGILSIDCKKFSKLEDAQKEQETIIDTFRKKLQSDNYEFTETYIRHFREISCTENLIEIQTHIEIF